MFPVCEDCYELDALLFGGVIIVDIIGTAVLMVIVYKCTKKKTPTGPKQSTNRNSTCIYQIFDSSVTIKFYLMSCMFSTNVLKAWFSHIRVVVS